MDLLDFANFLRRQWLTIFLITLVTALAATTISFLQPPSEKLTLLFSVGVKSDSEVERSFDATKLSDDFADTVSGWLRSPTLSERVSGISGTSVALSGAAQAKQNFIVEATFLAESGELVPAAVKQILAEEVAKYNTESRFKFFTTLHGESRSNPHGNLPKTLAAAIFGGILLSILWLILLASFGGRVSSIREAEKVLRTRAAVIFHSPQKAEANFLKKLAKKTNGTTLLGADFDVKKLGLDLKTLELPREAEKIAKSDAKIVVVKLDKTRINTLRMIRSLGGEKVELAIWA